MRLAIEKYKLYVQAAIPEKWRKNTEYRVHILELLQEYSRDFWKRSYNSGVGG
jgi:hypothetical protein